MKSKSSGTIYNLGLILQMNGIALLAPLAVALFYNENHALTALVLSAFVSLLIGFFLTNFSQEGEMYFDSICSLMVLTIILLGIIGAIPYMYMGAEIYDKMSIDNLFINGFFESISGFTTTGLSTISNVEILPKSIIFFRGLSQWIGGVGIVYLMILFLGSPSENTRVVGELSGFEKIKTSFRGTFWRIIQIYLAYTVIFTALLFIISEIDLFTSINIVFSGISTGGFMSINDFRTILNPTAMGIITVMMIFGATSFSVHNYLWGRELRKILSFEFKFFIAYITIITILIGIIFSSIGESVIDIPFHVISAITTTGFQFINIGDMNASLKSILILIMLIGGSAFSTAGGIKIIRFIIAIKAVPWTIKKASLPIKAITPLKLGNKAMFEKDVLAAFLLMSLGVFSIFISSIIFTFYGYNFIDSIFEITSAFGTVGLTTGITEIGLPEPLKIILTLEMIIGRVEIIPFFVFIKHIFNR